MLALADNWYKAWSVWLLTLATVLAGLETILPELQQNLPDSWYKITLLVILVARVVKQNHPQPPEAIK